MDCSPPGSSVHGIFQARVLEWGAIAFSSPMSIVTEKAKKKKQKPSPLLIPRNKETTVKVKALSFVQLFATPWTIQPMEFSRPEYQSG